MVYFGWRFDVLLETLVLLRILGSQKRLCDGTSRREMLVSGALSLGGVTLAELLAARSAQAETAGSRSRSFGQAKACILLYLWGSPSQLETFDIKPRAPREIRGQYGNGIASSIVGYRGGEEQSVGSASAPAEDTAVGPASQFVGTDYASSCTGGRTVKEYVEELFNRS